MVSTLSRDQRALLVIDFQEGVVWNAHKRDEVVANIVSVIAKARAAGVPIIWVQHSDDEMPIDSQYWQLAPELIPVTGDHFVRKNYKSSFEATNLEELLTELQVGHLFITGAQTDNCVRHTSHAALERGYDITVVEDAHTTSDDPWDNGVILASTIIDEFNRSFHNYRVPGRHTAIITTEALSF